MIAGLLAWLGGKPLGGAVLRIGLLVAPILLLLLASALSLVTAPLVEPRYFILPWVFWRLLVPAPSSSPAPATTTPHQSSTSTAALAVVALETAWFALINAATMYVFLTRPFYWRDASDSSLLLDGGRVQRFMW